MDVPAETLHIQMDDIRNIFLAYPLGESYLASVIQVVGPRQVPEDLEERLEDRVGREGGVRS